MKYIAIINIFLIIYGAWIIFGLFLLILLDRNGKIDTLAGRWGRHASFKNALKQLTFFPYTIYDCWIKGRSIR